MTILQLEEYIKAIKNTEHSESRKQDMDNLMIHIDDLKKVAGIPLATPPTTKITHSPLNQNKMKLIYKITLLVLAVLAIIACLICIIVLISTMWKMFLAIIALVILALFAMWLSGKIYDELGIIPDIEHYEY